MCECKFKIYRPMHICITYEFSRSIRKPIFHMCFSAFPQFSQYAFSNISFLYSLAFSFNTISRTAYNNQQYMDSCLFDNTICIMYYHRKTLRLPTKIKNFF